MKQLPFLSLLFALAIWMLPACGGDMNNKPKDAEKMADKANDAKTETKASKEDADLLVDAALTDMTEIAAADVAEMMATQMAVKEFAMMMKTEHMKMTDGTKMLASKKAYTLPTSMSNDNMSMVEDMKKWKKGKEFDTKYIDSQVSGHEKMLDSIEKRMAATEDTDIKAWTQMASSAVRMHLDKAKMIQEDLKKMYK